MKSQLEKDSLEPDGSTSSYVCINNLELQKSPVVFHIPPAHLQC